MASVNTQIRAVDVDHIIHDGVPYTKKYTSKNYAGMKTEADYKAMWDGLFKEIDELYPVALPAVTAANIIQKDRNLPLLTVPKRTVYDAEFLNWKKHWTNGIEAMKIEMTKLLIERNTMFTSLVRAHRILETVIPIAVTSDIADVPQVDVHAPPVDEQIDGARPSVPETPVVPNKGGTNPFESSSTDTLAERTQRLKSQLDKARQVDEENMSLREELEKVKKALALADRMCQEKENLIVKLKLDPDREKELKERHRNELADQEKKTQENDAKLKQITEVLTLARTDNGKISRAIAVKTLVDFEEAVISKLKCKDQDVMQGLKFTGGTLEQFTELFDQHMKCLNDSAEAVGTKNYEEIAGQVAKVTGERDNLKGIIAKYEADKKAPSGGGDMNAALAAVRAEKLAVDGELATVKAEFEALNKKCTVTRDEVNMVEAKLALSEGRVTSERMRADTATAEVDRLKTALADETAKCQDLLNKAPTGPPPPSGGHPRTARLRDRVTILLEELQKLVPRLQSQPFVNRVTAITDLINRVFDDITAVHDKRQILTLIAQNLFPTGDIELRNDLDKLLAVI
jgi:hypothetical protein